jgi:hypothetical protein
MARSCGRFTVVSTLFSGVGVVTHPVAVTHLALQDLAGT